MENTSNSDIEYVIELYADMIYRIALSQVIDKSAADDIFQQAFLLYMEKQVRYVSEEHRKAWLIRTTLNVCKKYWSNSWMKKTTVLDDSIYADNSIYADMDEKEYDLYSAIIKLPRDYKSVIIMFYFEDMSIREIASILRKRESTIRTQLTRARYIIRDMLKGE